MNYEPSDWVLSVVGKKFRTVDSSGFVIYECFGYDPRHGFWMVNVDDSKDKRNVSERAIGNTYRLVKS